MRNLISPDEGLAVQIRRRGEGAGREERMPDVLNGAFDTALFIAASGPDDRGGLPPIADDGGWRRDAESGGRACDRPRRNRPGPLARAADVEDPAAIGRRANALPERSVLGIGHVKSRSGWTAETEGGTMRTR